MLPVLKTTKTNKNFRFKIAAIASTVTLLFSNSSSVWGQSQPKTSNTQCEPIAKIINGDRYWPNLTKVCKEAEINPAVPGVEVEVFCYLRGNILRISAGTIGSKCLPFSKQELSGCTQPQNVCTNIKGPDDNENAPTLISPLGVMVINPRPKLSWKPTPLATSYLVQVQGKGVNWSVETKGIQLAYPLDQPAMQPENVYDINITAMRGEDMIPSPTIVIVLSDDRAQQVAVIKQRLKKLNQPQDDFAIDLVALYKAQGLLNDAIEALSARKLAGSSNPTIYRMLGDCYLEADSPKIASTAYETAIILAKKANNTQELTKAIAGAKIAAQAQKPPTRMKLPQ